MRLLVLAVFSAASLAAQPDVLELARRSMATVKANRAKTQQYAYRERRVNTDRDKNGKETDRETRTSEIIGLEGSSYRKLVMKNDQPLSPREQRQEEEKLRKEQQIRKEENSGKRPRRVFSLSYSFFLPYDKLIDIYDLQYGGEGEIADRPAYVVKLTPKPAFHPATDDEKEALNYAMKMWLDRADCFPVRIEGEVTGEHSRLARGSRFRVEDARPDGDAWLPSVIEFQYSARVAKLFTARGEATTTFSDYRRFQVDSNLKVIE
ncbi:MAG TPA: hypothetical protein VGF59_25965 [Bryobacteraceae bacterium]|jgi:hypothetical protein